MEAECSAPRQESNTFEIHASKYIVKPFYHLIYTYEWWKSLFSHTMPALSFSFSIYLPYLRRTVVTSQIICALWCQQTISQVVFLVFESVLTKSSIKETCRQLSKSTSSPQSQLTTSLITPAARKWILVFKKHCTMSVMCFLPLGTVRFYTLLLQPVNMNEQDSSHTVQLFTLWLMTFWKEHPPMAHH